LLRHTTFIVFEPVGRKGQRNLLFQKVKFPSQLPQAFSFFLLFPMMPVMTPFTKRFNIVYRAFRKVFSVPFVMTHQTPLTPNSEQHKL